MRLRSVPLGVCMLLSHAHGADLTVAQGATDDLSAGTYAYNHVQVNGTLTVNGVVDLTATTMWVSSTGTISGDGRSSHGKGAGPAAGASAETPGCTWSGTNQERAGSHGGAGGGTNGEGRCIYGSTFEPVTQGTGSYYRAGGAALKITAGDLRYDGTIDMDGNAGSHDQSGAAGGSAWVTTGTLSGSGGTIRAHGGNQGSGNNGDAGGGGGRIALYCSTSTYESTDGVHGWELPAMTVHGGDGDDDGWDGGCGTVYVDCHAVRNTLLLDGGSKSGTPSRPTLLADRTDPPTTSYTFDTVHIIRSAELGVRDADSACPPPAPSTTHHHPCPASLPGSAAC